MIGFSHLLLTRFNVRLDLKRIKSPPPGAQWLRHRFDLFDRYCYPSVRQQSCLNFKWLVFFDINTPDEFADQITMYARWENFIPCFIRSFSFASPEIRRTILDHMDTNASHLITTRLDNDDALHDRFIVRIQQHFRSQCCEFVNFPDGYILRNNKLYSLRDVSNPFLSLIENAGDIQTVWCEAHNKLPQNKITQIEGDPLWLQVVHDSNLINRVHSKNWRVSIRFLDNFKINRNGIPNTEPYLFLFFENVFKALKVTILFFLKPIRCILKSLDARNKT